MSKLLLYLAPGADRARALEVDDERAAELLSDPASGFRLVADDEPVKPAEPVEPATTEPAADDGEGQPDKEE